MRNAVLHLITNKAGDFGIDNLPSDSSFVPYTTTSDEDEVRNLLLINEAPYYLTNSLIAVYSFSDILAEFRESEKTYELRNFPRACLAVTNATYANTPTENFNILNNPDTFPSLDYTNWTIAYNNDTTLTMRCCDQRFTVPYTLSDITEEGDSMRILAAEWPAITGIKGGFQLDSGLDWSYGSSITLSVPPATFPYGAAVRMVSRLPRLADILNNAGVAKNYHNAQSDIEKYALLMLALANPAVRNPI